MSNSLDPDQARCSVGPDLDPNCLQMLSADDTYRQTVKIQCTCDSYNSRECTQYVHYMQLYIYNPFALRVLVIFRLVRVQKGVLRAILHVFVKKH